MGFSSLIVLRLEFRTCNFIKRDTSPKNCFENLKYFQLGVVFVWVQTAHFQATTSTIAYRRVGITGSKWNRLSTNKPLLLHFEKQRLELGMWKVYQNINISIFLNKNKYLSICFFTWYIEYGFFIKIYFRYFIIYKTATKIKNAKKQHTVFLSRYFIFNFLSQR